MKKAKIKIKKDYGNFTERNYTFWTDMDDLKKGDVVTAFTKYGLQIGLFVSYTDENFEPNNFLIEKLSGVMVSMRIKEQKDALIRQKLDETSDFVKRIYAL
ncbi:MAG: hypothetical protein DI638_02165 [Gemella sp.]|nr:MAG: hypothetical protein DI638_02165 [Gemella sp.]